MAKPRVIISTDIGGSDPDDMESMAHALLASDKWDIQALISTPTKHDGRTSDIYKALDAYTKDYANLKTWSDYPTPAYLKSIVYQGNVNVAPSAGYSSSTEASRAIVNAAKEAKAAGEPLWVMTWGAATDVAQALHDAPSIASTVRVLASNGWNWKQDPNAYEYVKSHAENGMWMIDSKSTHRGIYVNSDGVEDNPFNMSEAKGHGALGDYFYWARPWGVKMGDSWSIAYLTDQANNGDPRADSWGGEFVRNGTGPNYWTDDTSSAYKIGNYNGAAHVREHQMDIYKDMYRLFNRAKSPNPNGDNTGPDPDTDTPSTGGSNDPVYAYDDTYQLDPGKTMWENSRFLLYNDKGADGGLKVTQVDSKSAQGVSVSWASDGTIKYTAKSGFVGTDTIGYTIVDADGSSDRAKMVITVGDPSSEPAPAPAPAPSGGTNNDVYANDDHYALDPGKTMWENSRFLAYNDKGEDGGLKVTQVDGTSANGRAVSWASDGTIKYTAASGFDGTDTIGYTVVDADGSSDRAKMVITVGDPSSEPDPTPTPTPTPTGGTGNDVYAQNDQYDLASGATKWEAARYLTWNDKGDDGSLKVTQVDDTSANGLSVSFDGKTIVYKSKAGFNGTDTVGYTVADGDGSSDRAKMVFTVGDPSKTEPEPEPTPEPAPTAGGTGNDVNANNEWYQIDAGKSLWVNSRYFTHNDDGPDGGLEVTAVDAVSANGGRISWVPEGEPDGGTTKYTPAAGFDGRDSFEYTVVDQDGSSDVGTVFVQVVDVFA